MEDQQLAVHRAIVVVDIKGFGDRHRTNREQVVVRDGLYHVMQEAFGQARIPWDSCDREDRGDGMLVLVPPQVPKVLLAESLPSALVTALRAYNAVHPGVESIRLRMALHAGEVHYDKHGVTAAAVNLTFRLVEADALKVALAGSRGVLAVIASAWFFDEVARHSSAAPAYRLVEVTVKETTTTGWICLPDQVDSISRTKMECATGISGVPGIQSMAEAQPGLWRAVPQQLPAAIASFAGRADELLELTNLLQKAVDAKTVVISAVGGTAGIGKTTLAVHWAHQVAGQFSDGQLYVNLRGFGPTGQQPTTPKAAIRAFLDALGVPREQIPVSLDAQAALYRTLLSGRQVLVVLDNARDADQVARCCPARPAVSS